MVEFDSKSIKKVSKELNIPVKQLRYYNDNNILPSRADFEKIEERKGVNEYEIMVMMGIYSQDLKEYLRQNRAQISFETRTPTPSNHRSAIPPVVYQTQLGRLYQGDCIDLLKNMDDESVDIVFADPPFNLNKFYPSGIDDQLKEIDYLKWCESWMGECIRVLKDGGSLFLWNIPKWHTFFAEFLNNRLTFRHWISADIKFALPIQGKLYPSHYSLLYYCKGARPNTFHPDRLPMEVCPKCKTDLKDYGGYKNKMNPLGINLTDVWYDIPPVRHSKYKKRKGANELSVKLLDRIIEMSSNPGDIVFDPFGGSGSTYAVAEMKGRKWIGIEMGPSDPITERLESLQDDMLHLEKIRKNYNQLFTKETTLVREAKGLWTVKTFHGDQPVVQPASKQKTLELFETQKNKS